MESDGGGKIRPKRSQSGNKPYDRKSSIFGRFSSSVKDLSQLLIPSWLAGESSDGKPNIVPEQLSDSNLTNEAKGSQLVERLKSGSMVGSTSYSSNQDSFHSGKKESFQRKEQQNASVRVPHQRSNLLSKNNSSSYQQGGVGESASHLRMSDSYLDEKDDTNLNTSEKRSIMVSTGSFSRTMTQSENKRQKLWSPEFARQGKPMTPPTTDKPAFNSSLFGSMNQGDVSLFGDNFRESSFYSGKTRFGGASSERKQPLNKSLPYQSSLPLRKQVKANKMNSSYQAVTSATAQRILETLDRMSTPLGDAKKIPQPETSDSVLSFTPSSYRRTSLLGMNKSVTRPLQLPKGPPKNQYQTAHYADIRRNRYQPSEKDQGTSSIADSDNSEESDKEHKRSFISQEQTTVRDKTDTTLKHLSSSNAMSGKMKTKRFSQHVSNRVEEEESEVPSLRTDFTLPVSSMTPISMPSFPVKSVPKAKTSIPSLSPHEVSSLKFTFSTPIQKSKGGHDLLNTNEKDFTFSSPIQASKTCAAGAEEAPKWSPEPAIGASSVTSVAFSSSVTPVWGSTKAKPKASSPDIGGTSSSFKSYSKWGDNENSAAAESPGILAPASSLKQGSVMDILGGGGKKLFSPSTTSPPVSNTVEDDLMAKFRKPIGDWECDTCMIHNNANATKCLACETPKPGVKKSEIAAPKENTLSKVIEISSDLLNKFKPTGNWECDTCMLNNKPDADKCVACEAVRPDGKIPHADKANNNSLSAMFKKPEGNWECDTCMVQNTETDIKCVACDSSKPGHQSTGGVLKPANGSSASIVTINPGGGFSFNIPSATSATTQGSGGFKFGNATSKTSPVPTTATGFVFGQTTNDSKPTNNSSEDSSGGFKFGSSSTTSVSSLPKKDCLVFGASGRSASPVDSKASQGFQFSTNAITTASNVDKKSTENCIQTSSLFMKSTESLGNKTDVGVPSKLGFQFSSTSNGPVTKNDNASNLTDSKTEVLNTGQQPACGAVATFTFGAPSSSAKDSSTSSPFSFSSQPIVTNSNVAQITKTTVSGLFSFSSAQQAAPSTNAGLGMGKSLSDTTNSTPVMNGGFGSFLDTQSKKDTSVEESKSIGGFGATTPSVFAFGQSAPTLPISTPSAGLSVAQKRSVDLNDTDHSAAKKSAGNQPVTNGLFAFGASSTSAFGSAQSTNSVPPAGGGFGGFGIPTPKPIGATPVPSGGFAFGSSGPGFGQTSQPVVTPSFGSSSGQTGGFSFNSTPDFNFSSGSSQGNAPFQFGGNSSVNAAPGPAQATSGLFQFSSTPSANVVATPVFGGAPAGTGVGSFSIGSSSETGRRPIKKAVRKIPKR